MKTCRRCLESKSTASFGSNKRQSDGFSLYCRPCAVKFTQEWAAKNPERKREIRKNYSIKNKDKERAYAKAHRAANRNHYNAYQRDRRHKDPERFNAAEYKRQLRRRYGITQEQYDAMFRAQNGSCAICGGQSLDGKRLHVDHDHKTGKVRGLLCINCNHGLGKFQDSADNLTNAWAYLARHSKPSQSQEVVR